MRGSTLDLTLSDLTSCCGLNGVVQFRLWRPRSRLTEALFTCNLAWPQGRRAAMRCPERPARANRPKCSLRRPWDPNEVLLATINKGLEYCLGCLGLHYAKLKCGPNRITIAHRNSKKSTEDQGLHCGYRRLGHDQMVAVRRNSEGGVGKGYNSEAGVG